MGLFGDILGGIGGAVSGLVTGGPAGAITGAARGAGLIGGANGGSMQRGGSGKSAGGRGIVSRRRGPGGVGRDTVRIHEEFGPWGLGGERTTTTVQSRNGRRQQAGAQVAPMIGAIGTEPEIVGQIQRQDGSTGPIRRCPQPNFVLAIDGRCYPKKMVSKQFRKWPPDKKPPITRSEWNALLKARRAVKSAKRVGRKVLEIQGKSRKSLPVED